MAINDLLDPDSPEWRREAERLRRERMPPRPGQAQPRPALDPVARAAANRVRFPTDTGIGASGERVFGDTAARTAAPSASVQSAPPAPRSGGRWLNRVRNVGRAAPPIMLGMSARDTMNTPTEAYYQRFGIQPRNDGTITGDLLPNLAIRTLGAASDIGNTLTFGIADGLYRDRQADASPSVAAPPTQQPQAQQQQAPTYYRSGNRFSDQTIDDGGAGAPQAIAQMPGRSATDNYRAYGDFLRQQRGEQERQLARRDASIDAEINRANRSTAIEEANAAARSADIRAGSLLMDKLPARLRREAVTGALSNADAFRQQAQALRAAPATPAEQTPSVAEVAQQFAQVRSAEEQGIGAGLQNQAVQRQQQVIDQFGQLPADDPRRRQLIDRALVGAGKDPEAGRYQTIEAIAGVDAFGVPVTTRSLFDTRRGQVIQPPAATFGVEPPSNHIAALKSNPKLAQQFDEKYGKGAAARYLGQ